MNGNSVSSNQGSPNIEFISTQDLLSLLDSSESQIIDTRPVEFYNGWKEFDQQRGGHIKGARSLPSKWASYLDWLDIVKSKGILPSHQIVLYGSDPEEVFLVSKMFFRAGFSSVQIYDKFLSEWIPNESLPMEFLPRYKHLVSAQWLKLLMDTGKAPEYDNDRFVICHGHYRNEADYEKGHIEGAISMDTNSLESIVTWNRKSPEELKETLESMGITHDTTVIVYGRFSFPKNEDPFPGSSAGHLGSIRCAAIMLYAGVKDVRVLNGGLQSWLDAGFEITTVKTKPICVSDFGVIIPAQPNLFVDTPEAKEIIASPQANLVSIRSWPEYIGEVSGYNYIEKKGRIPGSIFGNCGTDAYHMENYRNLDHTTREYQEIVKELSEIGVTPDKHNAFYCGTGWRGSEAFFNAWLLGWPKVSVYDGGWFEWSNDPSNPIETGNPNN